MMFFVTVSIGASHADVAADVAAAGNASVSTQTEHVDAVGQADPVATEEPDALTLEDDDEFLSLEAGVGNATTEADEENEFTTRRIEAGLLRYAEEIKRLEAENGAYDAGLSQELTGLGLLFQRVGLHTEAIDSFRRAIHVSRVNEGLYNFSEVPILEEMIESHAALGEWEEVNDRYHFLFQVHNRNYGRADPRVLPALEKLSNWHLQAYSEEFSGNPLNHLLTARNLFDNSVRIIAVNFGDNDPRLAEPLRKRTMVDYYLATHVPQGASAADVVANVTSFTNIENDAAVASFMVNSYSIGKRALGTIRDIYVESEDATLQEQVAAVVELGDWHMLFERRQSAFRTYREALDLLGEDEEAQEVHGALFGKPIALPAARIFDTGKLESTIKVPEGKSAGYVLVKFQVNQGGRARNLELVEAEPPDRTSLGSKLRKRIRATKFRPRFEGSQPVSTDGVFYRYEYYY